MKRVYCCFYQLALLNISLSVDTANSFQCKSLSSSKHIACLHEHDSAKQIDLKIQILNRCILRQNRIIRSSLHVSLTIVFSRFNE